MTHPFTQSLSLPYSRDPAPAPDDWRARCMVQESDNGRFDVVRPCRHFYLNGSGSWSLYSETHALPTRCATGSHPSESSARLALSLAPPYPGYTPPLPAKVEGDVDAKWVWENPGDYRELCNGAETSFTYRSNGRGGVDYKSTHPEDHWTPWGGVRHHEIQQTRFLPLPPKDNKCESSSGCGHSSPTPSSAAAVTATPSPASGTSTAAGATGQPTSSSSKPGLSNPSEPVASGEPVNPYSIYNENRQAWNNAADAWRAYHASEVAGIVSDRKRAEEEHDSLMDRYQTLQHEAEKAKGEIASLRYKADHHDRAHKWILQIVGIESKSHIIDACLILENRWKKREAEITRLSALIAAARAVHKGAERGE